MGDGDFPLDPVTELAAGAAQLHELYEEYVRAGFTAAQAMQIVCTILRATLAGGGE